MNIFWGKVRKHNQRGKKLGFPTANVNLAKNIAEGVYLSKTKIGKNIYPGLTFIGKAKTFNERKFHAETYILSGTKNTATKAKRGADILDFEKNLYGAWISVELLKKIRGNRKFDSVEELIKEMKKDEQVAREYFRLPIPNVDKIIIG